MTTKKKKEFKLPHVYILMSCVMLFIVLLSFIVPSGEMGRIEDDKGRMVVDPTDFHYVDDTKTITPMDFFKSMHEGIIDSADIVIMLCLAAGAIHIVEQSGTIKSGIESLLKVSAGKEYMIIAVLIIAFSILGTAGISEETIPIIPLIIAVVTGMGYDKFVGIGIVLLGIDIGFSAGVLNVYTTGVAQDLVGLPLFSGIEFRTISLILFNILTIGYIVNYAKKIKLDPSKSLCKEHVKCNGVYAVAGQDEEDIPFTLTRKIVLFGLIFTFLFQAYGAINLGWELSNISALYIMYTVVASILLKIEPSDACRQFGAGAKELFPAAITIGLARGAMILMNQAKIIDTGIYALSQTLQGKPPIIIILLVYIAVCGFNFFVTSGSGKAVILMPILEPLGQLVGVNQQVMVLIFNFGDGITNYVWPTASTLMACLGVADVEWTDWIKFAGKFFAMLLSLGFILTVIAHYINLGPF